MTQKIVPIILCGGSGTRLWPLSRKSYPKQFSRFVSDHSLFQACVKRVSGTGFSDPVIVTADPFRFIAKQQIEALEKTADAILIEPSARDTAPAILAAALRQAEVDANTPMLVVPSDHLIPDAEAFRDLVLRALPSALEGQIVTFGVQPTRPETGYGYIELSARTSDAPSPLRQFVEKPDSETAQFMFDSGNYLWNAGIFLFTAGTILRAYQTHEPDMVEAVRQALTLGKTDLNFFRLAPNPWDMARKTSVDFAIMEKATNISVMPLDLKWSDLGDWAAVKRETQTDGNSVSDQAMAIDCENVLLRSENKGQRLVALGLNDMVAVAMPDAVLVAHKDRTQDVKKVVEQLKAENAPQAETFPKDHRPWGSFESLARGERFQVKRIIVDPGEALSLQSHHHRAEHWIVVEGTAKVTIENDIKLVTENQSVYIPVGAKHRLENPGRLPMTLIEVQTGSYLGEDDILRFEDIYDRK